MPIAITPRRKKDAPEVKRGEKAKPINKMPVKKAGGGKLKAVPEGKKGLSKLPAPVRNKMGFMKKGGLVSPPKKRGDIGQKVFLSKVAKQMKKSGQPFGGKKTKGKK